MRGAAVLAASVLVAGAAGWFLRGAVRDRDGAAEGTPPRAPAPAREGPPPAATPEESSVRWGLEWLRKVQEGDGSWSLHAWNPRHGRPGLQGFSEEDHWFDPAATGLVLLAALEGDPAAGGPDDASTRRAIAWLLLKQRADGRIGWDEVEVDRWFVKHYGVPGLYAPDVPAHAAGPGGHAHGAHGSGGDYAAGGHGPGYKAATIHTYNHAVPLAALATAYARTRDPALREPVRRAVANVLRDEHPEYNWTTYYDPESDVGVSPYVVIAAAALAGTDLAAETKPLLDSAAEFFDVVTDPASGRTRVLAETPVCFDGDDSTAIAAFCRRLLGQDPASGSLAKAAATFVGKPLAWKPAHPDDARVLDFHEALGAVVNHEFWFHGVAALRGVAVTDSATFTARVKRLLMDNQVRDGALAGSWDPIGVWDRVGGRLYSTAMAVRTLAVR